LAALLRASPQRSVAAETVNSYNCGFSRLVYSRLRMDGKRNLSGNAGQGDNVYAAVSADHI
jgi:hypothetical protein